jgi:hypothetical protein
VSNFYLNFKDIDKTSNEKSQKKIIVVDKDTGVEQYLTKWSNGLAQFLELKYKRSISVESLKAVFISNKTFFQRYSDENLFGLTGTLGSDNSMGFLADLYNVKFADVPTSRDKTFHMLPGMVSFNFADWLECVSSATIKEAKKRPVLIISENLEMTTHIESELLRHGVSPCSIIKYGRDGDSVEERFKKRPAASGDIILATNKGGRGTDINVDSTINANYGGLHVVLTFLPENVRIEEQAFGRTSRNGAPGTGQFILRVERGEYEAMYDLSQYSASGVRARLEVLGDVIIEREKINRDNKETARLCELKKKNILHLEIEENLFETFSMFKNENASKVIEKIMKNYSIDIKLKMKLKLKFKKYDFGQEIKDAFEKSLKNKWAFWLDEAAEKIKKINTKADQQALKNEFKLDFIDKKINMLAKCSDFEDLVTTLTEMPEETIHIGKVCLKFEKWHLAKYCFDHARSQGDITGFANIGTAFCSVKINSTHDSQFKKELRREMKQAIVKVELLKQGIMSNYKMADFLSQYSSDKQNQSISTNENLYQEQVRGKLEVIGLQLSYLKRSVGSTLEPSDFIIEKTENVDDADLEKANEVYKLLVESEIIQKETLTKSFNYSKYSKIIKDNLDPSVADSLVELLSKNKEYELKDVEKLVCSCNELWEALGLSAEHVTECHIIDLNKVTKELKDDQMTVWKTIETKIDPLNVDIGIFKASTQLQDLKDHLVANKFLTKTRRVKIENFNVENLKLNGKYAKYAKLEYTKQAYDSKKNGIIDFLSEMREHILKQNGEYFYEINLPFGTKEEEAKKLWMFLKEKMIIKSGGLRCHKYGNTKEQIENKLKKILENNSAYENDKDFILAKLISIQGTIRASEERLEASLKDFMDLDDQEVYLSELDFFAGVGLNKFIVFKEEKSWWDWRAFAVAMLGLAQVIGGATLCCFGFVNIGQMLICEGINDMVYATMAGLSGTFSWRDWAIQKAISMALSIITCGIGKLASLGQTATKVGSLSKSAIFLRYIGQSCLQFATTVMTNIITEKTMSQISEGLIKKIVEFIETNFMNGVNETIQTRVESLYISSQSDKEFEKRFSEMRENFDKAVGNDVILNNSVKSICTRISSTLSSNMQTYGTLLAKSSDKRVKAVGNIVNGVLIVDKVWRIINGGIQTYHLVNAVVQLVNTKFEDTNKNENAPSNRKLKTELVKTRVEQIIQILRSKIMSKLSMLIANVVRAIVGAIVNKIATVAVNATSAFINSCMKGKNPLEQNKANKDDVNKGENVKDFQDSKEEKDNEAQLNDVQNNIKNPKDSLSDDNRPLGLADIRMLANQKMRNIEITDKDTGEKIIVRPEGFWRKIPAFFKQAASINFKRDYETGVGHYFTAKGTEMYKQVNGRNDCLLIAYHESLGRTVNEGMIRRERENLINYTLSHSDDYQRYVHDILSRGLDLMLGGVPQIDGKTSYGQVMR